MANTFTKSDAITTLDATSPTLRLTSGRGGMGRKVQLRAMSAVIPTAQAATVVSRLVRIPTNAFVSKVALQIDTDATSNPTLTTFAFNVGLYASDSTVDGTPPFWQGYNTAISATFFAKALTLAASNAPVDITFANALGGGATDGYYTPGASEYPIWDAVQNGGLGRVAVTGQVETSQGSGYSSGASSPWTTPANGGTVLTAPGDPGGFVDIGVAPSAALSITASVYLLCVVELILG